MSNTFRALVLDEVDGQVQATLKDLEPSALPAGDVTVAVAYSSLNYKDGLAITGQGKIVRSYPMVPGIDFAGTVTESSSPDYKAGDEVILTGWFVGERHWGGMAQQARVKAGWLVPRPAGLSAKHAMSIGTAGITAMMAVIALEEHGLKPGDREVVVTGAAGGVGSVAVAILAQLGYKVVASTGRATEADYLKSLGAHEVIDRAVLGTPSKRPLESERWAGAVDTVGGETLAGVLRSLAYGGSVAVCGNAGGPAVNTTVFPFILRNANVLGIDSVQYPLERRRTAWARLTSDLPQSLLDQVTRVVPLSDVPALSQDILKGQVRGRVVIDVNA